MDNNRKAIYSDILKRMAESITSLGDFNREEFVGILSESCEFFNVAKGVTEFYESLSAEKEGIGETLIDFDNGKGEKPILSHRIVTPNMTVIKSTLYVANDAEPLSDEDLHDLDLLLRITMFFVSRNRLTKLVDKFANYDEFGYPNLNYFMKYLETLKEKGMLDGNTAIQFNLRQYSIVNKEIGRDAGDIAMRRYFEAFRDLIGDDGIICRVGGDNFAAVFKNKHLQKALRMAEGYPVVYDDENEKRIMISACAGVFVFPDNYVFDRAGEVIGRIFSTAQDAKLELNGTVVYYNEKTTEKKEKYMHVRRFFKDALANGEFQAFYQPKVNIETGEIVGAEALCRWMVDNKIIAPVDFIPALEQNTDICSLDLYMLDLVCKDIRRWLDEGRRVVRVSVNLSRKNLIDPDLIEHLLIILKRYDIPHKYIEFELTETTTDVEFTDLKRIVNGLREKNICITVDDFGVGYSSLNLIREIPWDVLKLDKCFIPTDENYGVTELMFRYVVGMAKAMGLECVAEGVETRKQIEILRENDCLIAQGYFFDKPLPVKEFEEKLDGFRYM
ncbi:MAG: GGDEF domain-containing protein [Ruminiclostridium sp.]|nr:GGDEF domain-containing protein [Ruminiclostridium sp.]